MRRFALTIVFAASWSLLFAATSRADTIVDTSFTSSATENAFQIITLSDSDLIQGQSPFTPSSVQPLTLSFDTPIFGLSLVFAIDAPMSSVAFLRLTTPVGGLDQAASVVGGGNFPGGTLTFNSAVPFTSATLQAFLAGGHTPAAFQIDRVTVSTAAAVPEPSTLVLIGLGMSVVAGIRYRTRKK